MHEQKIAEFGFNFGRCIVTYCGSLEGASFAEQSRKVLEIVDALDAGKARLQAYANFEPNMEKISAAQQRIPCKEQRALTFHLWSHHETYSTHGGWRAVNIGLSSDRFDWTLDRLARLWPPNQGNYTARGFVIRNAREALFEAHCYGIGD